MTIDSLEPEDRAWAENWLRLRLGLHLVRRHRPRAFAWLVINVPKAAEIATRHGWDDPQRLQRAPTDAEINAVANTLRALEPRQPTRSPAQQRDALSGLPLRPAYLTPKQLGR
jgi:hypothetical protein